MRMSKLRLADYHYRKAATIHPQNAVLLGCVGMVSQAAGPFDDVASGHDADRARYLFAHMTMNDPLYTTQVQERYGKLDEALRLFDQAVHLSKENALVRYHRAKVLIAKKQYKVRSMIAFLPIRGKWQSADLLCFRSCACPSARYLCPALPLSRCRRPRLRTLRRSETRPRMRATLSSSLRRCTA